MALLAKLAFVTAGAWVWIQSSAIYIKHLFSLKCLEKTKTKKKRPGKVNKQIKSQIRYRFNFVNKF